MANRELQFRRVFVTGGAGFIGAHVTKQLLHRGHHVRVLERDDAFIRHLPQQAEIVRGDICDGLSVQEAMGGCDCVVHLAANPNLWARNPQEFEDINHQGTRRVLEAARTLGIGRVVHVSTESILTSSNDAMITESTPLDLKQAIGPYCRSKALAEMAANEFARAGLPVIVVSPTVPVGPGDYRQGPLTRLFCQFARGSIRGFMNAELNLIDVRDVAEGIVAALTRGRIGRRYLLAAENWRVVELFALLSRLTGVAAPRFRVPFSAALAFAWFEEWYCRFNQNHIPVATVTGIKLARRSQKFDGSITERELGLNHRSCVDSIKEQIEWLSRVGQIPSPAILPSSSIRKASGTRFTASTSSPRG